MSTHDARTKFALKVKQTKYIRMNQLSNPEYSALNWRCPDCHINGHGYFLDSQSHLKTCLSYKHLRENMNLDNDLHLVRYFQSIVKMRSEMLN